VNDPKPHMGIVVDCRSAAIAFGYYWFWNTRGRLDTHPELWHRHPAATGTADDLAVKTDGDFAGRQMQAAGSRDGQLTISVVLVQQEYVEHQPDHEAGR